MFNIASYFEKFNKLDSNNSASKEMVCSALKSVLGIDIAPEDVNIKERMVSINCNHTIKNEIQIRKESIEKLIPYTLLP